MKIMTIEEVKGFLNQALLLDKRINTLQDELTMLESKLERCTPSYTSIKGGGNQPTFEYNLDKVMKYREMLNREIDNLVDRKRDIKQAIEKLDNDKEKLILYKKYINFQTFESIASDLGIEQRQVYRIYKKSLEKMQNVIECQY